ncbi:hypothetical protein EDC04DRAFT_1693267 [Pisolithus marmoratus]|nr:hypothetical protein EDC04DRAFT_1693267 [Pisolithus marmoratus]
MAHQNKFDSSNKCHFFEIVQYFCEMEQDQHGGVTPRCFPTPRLFKTCPRRPAVEITKIAKINLQTGEIGVPDESVDLPDGKPWQEVHTHKCD